MSEAESKIKEIEMASDLFVRQNAAILKLHIATAIGDRTRIDEAKEVVKKQKVRHPVLKSAIDELNRGDLSKATTYEISFALMAA